MSNFKVFVLMAAMTAIFVAVGGAFGGTGGAWIALGLALVMNFFAYFNSSKMVLKAYKARIVSPQQAPELYATVDRLRQQAGLPRHADHEHVRGRRLADEHLGTPSGVGTAGSASPRPATEMFEGEMPLATKASRTALARRSESCRL